MELTDAQSAILEPRFRAGRREDGRDRPGQDKRGVMNGFLWVLRDGAPWHDLPRLYLAYQTCQRPLQQWQRSGLLTQLLRKLAEELGVLELRNSICKERQI